MANNLKLLGRLFEQFGLFKGIELFIRFLFGYTNEIKLPGIKYPFSLRHKTSDISVFYDIFLKKEYDIKFPNNPNFVIDGGANIGLFTVLIKNKYPDAKIICIEPDPDNFYLLQKNVSSYTDVFCENCGIWNKDTKLKVYDKYNLGKWGIIVEEDLINGKIPAISINRVLEKYSSDHIDIIKLDIEASEKQLFSDDFESWLSKVDIVVIELHDRIQKGCSKAFFTAINKSFINYNFSMKGENIIIENIK